MRRLAPVWVALAVVAWLGFSLGVRRLALPDEGRYVGVSWEMLRSGDWLVPTLDGLPFFHKPPLFYWLTASSIAAFGPQAWSGRLASLLGALLAAMSLYLLLRRWTDRRVAGWALVILVTQPFFFIGAQFANLDMLVAGLIAATIALAANRVLCLETGAPLSRAALIGAYASAALGVLAKGLIGIALPVLVLVLWLTVTRRTRWVLQLLSLPGTLVFVLIAAPWFVAMQQRFDGFFRYFFIDQHFHRFALGGFNNVQPYWFLGVAVAALTLPWFPALWGAWRMRGADCEEPRRLLRVLLWIWFAAVLVFFSIPASKLIGYALPALPPLAGLIADRLWGLTADAAATWRRLRIVAAVAAGLCAGSVLLVRSMDSRSTELLAHVLAERRSPADAVVFAGGYYYDVPFHARLERPVQVVEAWTALDIATRDNWRKELFDAARFAPERGQAVLVNRQQFEQALCANAVTWVFAPRRLPRHYEVLQRLAPMASTERASLWRVERSACVNREQTPNAGLPGS